MELFSHPRYSWRDPSPVRRLTDTFSREERVKKEKAGTRPVGYVGSSGRKLFRYRDINQPVNPAVSTGRPFDNGPFAPSGGTFYYVNNIETSALSKRSSTKPIWRCISRESAIVNPACVSQIS